ncbi:MAG: universal stress protein [Alphaproteobacteria bacterium]|nr:universal stress protein [Alphaproteobacteria bacterium]
MAIKSILCIFGGAAHEHSAMNVTFQLGKLYGAQVKFIHLTPDLASYAGLYADGMMVNTDIITALQKDNQERMEKARKLVAAAAEHHHVPMGMTQAPLHHASASFKQIMGVHDYLIAGEGRLTDLIILSAKNDSPYDMITPALFDTGRPVLIMPAKKNWQWQDKNIALAWNGSLQSARALYNAWPLISKVENFYLLCGQKPSEPLDPEAEAALRAYVQAHGSEPQIVRVTQGEQSLSEALLSRAKELNADLFIMGAYGHSQFREMVLGGMTEFMLNHADMPLLLSH